jgi:hypothetical protein
MCDGGVPLNEVLVGVQPLVFLRVATLDVLQYIVHPRESHSDTVQGVFEAERLGDIAHLFGEFF